MVPHSGFGARIKGNQVKILDSTRCCNLHKFEGNPATVPGYGMGRPPETEKVRRPATIMMFGNKQ